MRRTSWTRVWLLWLALVAGALSGCCATAPGEHAAREAARHRAYLEHHDRGVTPAQARAITEAGLRAWEAQAYYLGTEPRPAWMEADDDVQE